MNISAPPDIGDLVRKARKERNLTLEGVSERSGVSRSMLSAIERGTVNPTFSILWALTQSLGMDLATFGAARQEEEPIEHQHSYSTPMRHSQDGKCELHMLSPRRTVLPVEWHRLFMEEGGVLVSGAHAQGTFEHLTCLYGALTITVNERVVRADAGDTVRYRADLPHRIENVEKGKTEALLLVALPSQFERSN